MYIVKFLDPPPFRSGFILLYHLNNPEQNGNLKYKIIQLRRLITLKYVEYHQKSTATGKKYKKYKGMKIETFFVMFLITD